MMYVVELYASGEAVASDCYPDFCTSMREAIDVGHRCLSGSGDREETHWATRFSIRKYDED